ncbi:MAG: hypothetical protein IPM53_29450 [Anaerolineaceae bacterium]|nr:hypothetical protein [Anaerolineaceae bacterium]
MRIGYKILLVVGVVFSLVFMVGLVWYVGACRVDEDRQTLIPQNASVVITLERTICFGDCPSYRLEIHDDGRVLYEGAKHVRQAGQHSAQISQADVQRLIAGFEDLNYYALVADYHRAANPLCVRDDYEWRRHAPDVITSLSVNGQRTEITHYHGLLNAPEELYALEDLIDEVANSEQWVKR